MLGAQSLTRRRVMAGTGTLLAGGATFAALTDSAKANVTLDIPDKEYKSDDGDLHAPWLYVSCGLEYQNVPNAARGRVELQVDGDPIGQRNLSLSGGSETMQFDMAGDVTDSSSYDSSTFTEPDDGHSAQVQVPVRLVVHLYDDTDTKLLSTDASTTVTITVTNKAGPTLIIQGTGEVRFQDNESDPAPI